MKLKKALLLTALAFAYSFSFTQTSPGIQWQKSLGGSNNDQAQMIQQTSDGGYIIAGFSDSDDGDVSGNHGGGDCWITKLNNDGTIQWQKSLGGSISEDATSIQQTTDGGYIVTGYTNSDDGDVSGLHGQIATFSDFWVIKLDDTGTIMWQKCLGGTDAEEAAAIQQTTDGGYIVAGGTSSTDGDVTGYHISLNNPFPDFWVVRLDSLGNIIWQKALGGSGSEYPAAIQQTSDGGFIVAGQTSSTDGDVTGYHMPLPNTLYYAADFWVVKIDSLGNLIWQKTLGGSGGDEAKSIRQTIDGGYIVAGYTNSADGDVTGYHATPPIPGDQSAPRLDCWVVKLDSAGIVKWEKCFGGSSEDVARSIQQTSDAGYIMAGHSYSNDGDVGGHHGAVGTSSDMWIVKLDSLAELQWQKSLGGSNDDVASSIRETIDRGYIVAGYSMSNDGDVTGHHGVFFNNDYWVVKLSPDDVLPISLLNFTVQKQDQSVLLNWQTAIEINTSFFNIQRSYDAIHFNNVGKLPAAGNSNVVQTYKYNDNSLVENREVYYRLQTVDIDGSSSYSKIEKVTVGSSEATFTIYPNPAKNIIYINANKKDVASVSIADNYGRIVLEKNIIINGKTSIPITKLSKGQYFVSAKNNVGVILKTIKLIVE